MDEPGGAVGTVHWTSQLCAYQRSSCCSELRQPHPQRAMLDGEALSSDCTLLSIELSTVIDPPVLHDTVARSPLYRATPGDERRGEDVEARRARARARARGREAVLRLQRDEAIEAALVRHPSDSVRRYAA